MWSVSPLCTALATRWVEDGTLERIAADRRSAAALRQRLAHEHLDGVPFATGPAAYHIWLDMGGHHASAADFALRVRDRGVLVTGAQAFYIGNGPPPVAARISLSAEPDLARLTAALDIVREVASGGGDPAPLARL